jgi:hypothetical protein
MKKLLSLGFLLTLLSVTAFAQLSTSNLTGTVSSPDGVLPGATVVVRDNKTNKEITVVTDGDGGFNVTNLEIGLYTVTITAQGFKTYTAKEVKLEVGRNYNLSAQLEVGQVTESVTITAGAEVVNSSDAKISGTVSNQQLTELPLLTRNPLGFVPLQAGVASNPAQNSTINGVRTSATNITIEGINVQDNFIRSNATDFSPARPVVDEVEEFSVSGQANVDDGFGSGQIQFPIRRGSNRFSGSLYEYNRNSDLGANTYFSNAGNVQRGFRNRNEFGGRVQGPLPFLNFGDGGPTTINGKDKLFFFFLYQKTIDVQPSNRLVTVLTNNARNGLFTYTAAANDVPNGIVAGQLVTVNLFNPAFGTGITAINPIIANRFLSRVVAGNSTDTGDQRVTTGYRFNQNNNAEQTNYTTRIDFVADDKNSIRGIYRYVFQNTQRSDIDASSGGYGADPTFNQPSANPFLSLGWTSNISSNFTNELVTGFSFSNPFFLRNDGLPTDLVTIPLITNPETVFLNQGRTTKAYNVQDNASYLLGNHSFRFGGQFQFNDIRSFNDGNGVGTDIIVPTYGLGTNTNTPQITTTQFGTTSLFPGTVPTAQRAAANSLLALLGGIVASGNQAFNVSSQGSGFVPRTGNSRKFRNEQFAFYLNDQWRVRTDLTLNLGVRYDYYTPVKAVDGLFFEPVIPEGTNPIAAILNPAGAYQFVGGNAGKRNEFYKDDKDNIAPNISFAYAPKNLDGFTNTLFGKTVLRGGFRISYINDELVKSVNNAGVGNAGLTQNVAALNPLTGTTALNARIGSLPTIPTPIFTPNRTFATNNSAAFNFFGTVYAINPNIKSPKVYEYSIGLQREIGFQTALEIRYVGTQSRNLLRAIDLNQVDIRNNGFAADFNRARSNLVLCQATAGCATGGAFNAAVPGSQVLTVFPSLGSGGLLTNATITGQLIAGTPADLAIVYIQNALAGSVRFLPNPGTGVVDYLDNGAKFNYNSVQIELRRRFADGFLMQANYTFSKNLTDSQGAQTNATGDTQNRFDPNLDNANPSLEYARALADQTHKFNLNGVYLLPFGKGRPFFSDGVMSQILGGFQLSGILQIGSGAPVSFNDVRGTLNRVGRSNRQTAVTSLTKAELKKLVGIYRTPNGTFFLPPAILGRNPDGTINTAIGGTGRGANGFGSPTFTGQIFFNNAPGTTSGLERNIVSGPSFLTLDMSLARRISFGERYSIQIQADAFNILNRTNFVIGQSQDVNSTSFGRITGTFAPRVIQLSGRFNF